MENGEFTSSKAGTDGDSSANERGFSDHFLTTLINRDAASQDALYFVRTEITGHIKIGRAVDVPRRLKNIASGNHEPIRLVGTIPNGGWQEPVWHELFSEHRASGEWFAPNEILSSAIQMAVRGDRWIDAFVDSDGWEIAESLLDLAEELSISRPAGRDSIRSRLSTLAAAYRELCV